MNTNTNEPSNASTIGWLIFFGLAGWWAWSSFTGYEMKRLYECIESQGLNYDYAYLDEIVERDLTRQHANGENSWRIKYRITGNSQIKTAYCRW